MRPPLSWTRSAPSVFPLAPHRRSHGLTRSRRDSHRNHQHPAILLASRRAKSTCCASYRVDSLTARSPKLSSSAPVPSRAIFPISTASLPSVDAVRQSRTPLLTTSSDRPNLVSPHGPETTRGCGEGPRRLIPENPHVGGCAATLRRPSLIRARERACAAAAISVNRQETSGKCPEADR